MKTYRFLNENEIRRKYGQPDQPLSPFEIGISLPDAADDTLKEIYYFRWHTYCRQI